jgi:hypothetical protein
LCGATAASATIPRLWKRFQSEPVATEIADDAPRSGVPRRAARRAPPAALAAPTVAELPATESTPAPTSPWPALPFSPAAQPVEPPSAVNPAKKPPSAKTRAGGEPVDPPASAAIMVEAMRERRAGNLTRARDLSAEYRRKYPGGALHEEALALSIEAATALGDDEARRLATSYLQRYPRGRFRAQAERVVASSR